MVLYNLKEVEAVKLAVYHVEYLGFRKGEIIIESILWLTEKYEQCRDVRYLEKVLWHIYAYLELENVYEEYEDVFQKVLNYLAIDKEQLLAKCKWNYREIKLNKTNVCSLIGRWNPGLQSMKIRDVVDDIVHNVSEEKQGEYLYHCGRLLSGESEAELWEQTYKLSVGEDARFHDVNRNKHYILIREKNR